MQTLRKSPFKVNKHENNPNAYGLRAKEIIDCADALYNNLSVLISGPRGIGKSSLGEQMRIVLEGNNTLLQRCNFDAEFPKTLSIYYACGENITLEQLVLDILYQLENEYTLLPQVTPTEIKHGVELNLLGVFKANLEATVTSSEKSPATIATQFVAGVHLVMQRIKKFRYKSICIMLDELDLLPDSVNFGSFLKIVHETLARKNLDTVNFLLAGQKGVFSRLVQGHKSFDRMIRHVPLKTLNYDASEYILTYAANKAKIPFRIEEEAKDAILGIASGHPDTLHLIGHSTFLRMENLKLMTKKNVVNGIMSTLDSDKREKYTAYLEVLSRNEKTLLYHLASYPTNSIPCRIPTTYLLQKVNRYFSDDEFSSLIDQLSHRGYLNILDGRKYIKFSEELFRLFIVMKIMEEKSLQILKSEKVGKSVNEQIDEALHAAFITESRREIESQRLVNERDEALDKVYNFVLRKLESIDDEDEAQEFLLRFLENYDADMANETSISMVDIGDVLNALIMKQGQNSLIGSNFKTDWDEDEFIFDKDELYEDEGDLYKDDYYVNPNYWVDGVEKTRSKKKGKRNAEELDNDDMFIDNT